MVLACEGWKRSVTHFIGQPGMKMRRKQGWELMNAEVKPERDTVMLTLILGINCDF
jgi:hypothetical protein